MDACAACRASFSSLEEVSGREKALWLDQAEPGCRCQHFSVSPYSRGVVDPSEVLFRVLVAPQHMDKKKRVPTQAALTHAETMGLSLLRERYATDDEVRFVATRLVTSARAANNAKAGVFGVLRMTCDRIRTFKTAGESDPAFCVYDTATQNLPSHVDAFQRIFNVDASLLGARRKSLFALVEKDFEPVETFRNGLLMDLAALA